MRYRRRRWRANGVTIKARSSSYMFRVLGLSHSSFSFCCYRGHIDRSPDIDFVFESPSSLLINLIVCCRSAWASAVCGEPCDTSSRVHPSSSVSVVFVLVAKTGHQLGSRHSHAKHLTTSRSANFTPSQTSNKDTHPPTLPPLDHYGLASIACKNSIGNLHLMSPFPRRRSQ